MRVRRLNYHGVRRGTHRGERTRLEHLLYGRRRRDNEEVGGRYLVTGCGECQVFGSHVRRIETKNRSRLRLQIEFFSPHDSG